QNKEATSPSVLSIAADGGIQMFPKKGPGALVTPHDRDDFTIWLLHEDINQGEQDGYIVNPGGKELPDDYSMFRQGLDWTNTRSLPETAEYILKTFMGIYEPCRIMVLGPGAGTELRHIDDIARTLREQGRTVDVDTISLSPLPPRFRLEPDSAKLWQQVIDYNNSGFSLAGMEEYYAWLSGRQVSGITRMNRSDFTRKLKDGENHRIPLSAIPPLQNAGFHVFSRLPEPYIHRQYIMRLTDILSLELGIQKSYHFIFDNLGGFYYTVMTEGLEEAVMAVDTLLEPQGLFYAHVVPWMKEELDEFEFPGLVMFVTATEPLRTLIVRKDSLHMRLLRLIGNVRQVSDGMYRVDNMDELVKKLVLPHSGAPGREGLSTVEDIPSTDAPVSSAVMRDGGLTTDAVREAVARFQVLDWAGMKRGGYSYSLSIPEAGRPYFRYLPTDRITPDILGYSDGLRGETPLGKIPGSIEEF
ncbi:MAG TPA: hypothetical protein PK562_07630, partial [Candidatus Omnitrophota bacterium]|nr:hypothetical protein [Candidatus Omnitrophota bacterium]